VTLIVDPLGFASFDTNSGAIATGGASSRRGARTPFELQHPDLAGHFKPSKDFAA
jgi:hypothetical protein